jgi:hypothetical protein
MAGLASCFPSVGGQWPDAAVQVCQDPDDPDGGARGASDPPGVVTPAVVEVQREECIVAGSGKTLDPVVVAQMLDVGLAALARQVRAFASRQAIDGGAETSDSGGSDPDGADDNPWPTLLPSYRPGQNIGIKVNCLGTVTTSPALVRALIISLRDKLKVDTCNIFLWDRFRSDLDNGKYQDDDLAGARRIGNLLHFADKEKGETNDDPALTNGIGYGDMDRSLPRGIDPLSGLPADWARVSRIVTHKTDLTINCLTFKTHNKSGITGAIKSAYGIIHNPEEYHKEFNDVAALLYAIPAVHNSFRLTICDAIVGVSSGFPQDGVGCKPKRILLAQDPVAMDSYLVDLMNQILDTYERQLDPKLLLWLDNAAKLGLGTRGYQLVQA